MKLYFADMSEELCQPLGYHILSAEENCLTEITIVEANFEKNSDYFYCKEFMAVGIKGQDGCGKNCKSYTPRNGKNGRCKFSNNCYEQGKKVVFKLVNSKWIKSKTNV